MKRLAMLALLLAACTGNGNHEPVDLAQVEDIAALDALSLFTFAIFSDNKGDGPDTGEFGYVRTMVDAVAAMQAEFVLGLGDHVKRRSGGLDQDWVGFMTTDDWWFDHFFPVIADGENAYYGSGQGDWAAGRGLLDDLSLCGHEAVTCRENHAEYHAVLRVKGIDVHFVVAHYPDSGDDPFPADSQRYVVEQLAGIERTGREIVIVGVHTGRWLKKMDPDQQTAVLETADLLLGASTHLYGRYDEEYTDEQALFLNTGSTGYALWNSYQQVNVVERPLRIVVQNMKAGADPLGDSDPDIERHLQAGENCWVKQIGGPVSACVFVHGHSWGLGARLF